MKANTLPQTAANNLIFLCLIRSKAPQTMYMPPFTCSVSPVM